MPVVAESSSLSEAIIEMTRKRLGMVAITDAELKVQGIYTDGDLRRTLQRAPDPHTTSIGSLMTSNGKTILPDALAVEAIALMQEHKVQGLLVVDRDGRLQGVLNFNDLLQAGVV